MDDLIRRSDAIEEVYKRIGADLDIDDVEYFEKIINSVTTVYDVDKVVEQLEARKTLAESIQEKAMDHAMFGGVKYMQPIVETIEEDLKIVKAGGVNE